MIKAEVETLVVKLEIESAGGGVFIELSRDGRIRRANNGRIACVDPTVYSGRVDGTCFAELLASISDDLLLHSGSHEEPGRAGLRRDLMIGFVSGAETREIHAVYGDNAEGLPGILLKIAKKAIRLTDGWWVKQRKAGKKPAGK
jgi:hypothetical protein